MPVGFATLPLGPAELRALADGSYSIIDQAVRTPGLLIIQSPEGEALGAPRSAFGDGATPAATDVPADQTPNADRPTPGD